MERLQSKDSGKSSHLGNSRCAATSSADMTGAGEGDMKESCKIFIRSAVPLSKFEVIFYFIVWGAVAGLMVIYCFGLSWEYEWEYRKEFRHSDFVWGWVDRQRKDVSEFEWNFWFTHWSPRLVVWVIGHSVISAVTSTFFPKLKLYVWIVYALSAVTYVLGYKSTLIFLFHCVVAYIATLTGMQVVVWASIVLLITTLNMNQSTEYFKTFFPDDTHGGNVPLPQYHLLMFSTAMFDMRLASFCLERCNKKDGDTGYSFVDLLAFVFYLPLMYTGPILTYDKFRVQVSSYGPWTKEHITAFAKKLIRQVFYILLIEYHLHYWYYTSMSRNFSFLLQLSGGEVAVLLYCKVMFFYLKYLPLFGVPSLFASLDQIQTPKGPACVSRISTFSEIWRTFDRGFHSFITRHIYIPMGGSRAGVGRQLLAVSACFGFIYIWHGTDYNLLIWAVVNFFGMLIEITARKIFNHESIRKIESHYISPQMSRRLTSLACVPPLCLSVLGLVYFFDGDISGNMFFRKCLMQGSWTLYMTTLLVLYCGVNAAFEAWNWEMKRTKEKVA